VFDCLPPLRVARAGAVVISGAPVHRAQICRAGSRKRQGKPWLKDHPLDYAVRRKSPINAPVPIAAPGVTSELSGKGDEQLASQLIVRGVGVGTARLDRDWNYRRILVGDIVDTAAELEVLQHLVGERQVDVVV
jgi:hypothetical protein